MHDCVGLLDSLNSYELLGTVTRLPPKLIMIELEYWTPSPIMNDWVGVLNSLPTYE